SAALSAEVTPRLWALAEAGASAPAGGCCSLPSTTYPGFASLLTGARPDRHLVWCTAADAARPAWAGQSQVVLPTLFERCRAAGRRGAAVLGDHSLYHVLRAEAADYAWPAGGRPTSDALLDAHGYAANATVRPYLLDAVVDDRFDFVFGHLNEVDTLGHEFGPRDARTLAGCSAT